MSQHLPPHNDARAALTAAAKERILVLDGAMWPGSSVSGLYFSHPDAYYFGVAKVERDQVDDYARRKGMQLRRD